MSAGFTEQQLYDRFARFYFAWMGQGILPAELTYPSILNEMETFVRNQPEIGKARDELQLCTPLHVVVEGRFGVPTIEKCRVWWEEARVESHQRIEETQAMREAEMLAPPSLTVEIPEDLLTWRTSALKVIAHDRANLVRLLLARGADLEARDEAGRTSLFAALSMVEPLGKDIAERNEQTIAYSSDQQQSIVELLLLRGADPNARDFSGQTPMHVAATKGHAMLFYHLLQAGADEHAKTKQGHSIRDIARISGWEDILVDRYLDEG